MPWAVKLDKEPDFIGRWALEHAARADAATRLVGFILADGHRADRGAVVLDRRGRPLGR